MTMTRSVLLFVVAALAEIGGGWMVCTHRDSLRLRVGGSSRYAVSCDRPDVRKERSDDAGR